MLIEGVEAWDFSPHAIFQSFTHNLVWSLFLTSTAVHAVLLIASPLQAVYKWYRRQCSDGDTAIPYLCGVVGSLLWLRYSVFIHDIKLILLQAYAVFMQFFFLVTMLHYRSKRRRLQRCILAVVAGMSTLFLLIACMPHQLGLQFTGTLASGVQVVGSLICPYFIYRAIKSRAIDFIPFAPVAFTWVMELHAIIYALGIHDFYLLFANTVFFCMDGCLLTMFFIFPTERKAQAAPLLSPGTRKLSVL